MFSFVVKCSLGGDDMRLFDAVEIINDIKPFFKGEKGHVVKVIMLHLKY